MVLDAVVTDRIPSVLGLRSHEDYHDISVRIHFLQRKRKQTINLL